MLLNKLLSLLCAITLLVFGGLSLSGLLPKSPEVQEEKTGEDRRASDLIEDDKEVRKDVKEEKTPEEEIEEEPKEDEEPNALFRNNAPEFYYYTQLGEDAAKIYDMIVETAYHPEIEGYTVQKDLSVGPHSEEFNMLYRVALEAAEYDHPELFWYFAQDSYPFHISYYSEPNASGMYRATMTVDQPFTDYETVMKTFNDAVDRFLADIDRTQRPEQIALAIHDKLVDLVTYDYETLDRQIRGYAHSAYGALVDNGRGSANYAVCDGYSKAYIYLLQQSGIVACEIIGNAGSSSLGLHAWNCIRLDGEWYEVDVTWDDVDPENDFADRPDDVQAILSDQDYMDRCRHAYFLLTTDQITDFTVPDDRYKIHVNNMTYWLIGDSKHYRVTAADGWPIADHFPTASGTFYSYESIKDE